MPLAYANDRNYADYTDGIHVKADSRTKQAAPVPLAYANDRNYADEMTAFTQKRIHDETGCAAALIKTHGYDIFFALE